MKRARMLTAGIGALVGIALLTGNVQAEPFVSSGGLKLVIPHDAISAYETPLWVAIDEGLFHHYGIEATTETIAPSPTLIGSMLSGETPVAIAAESAVINADLSGGDLAYLTTGIQKLFFEMFAAPAIHSVADLKGKRIGITQFGSTTDFIARYIAAHAGLDPVNDIVLVPMGTQQNATLAMIAGRLDASVLGAEIVLQSKDLGAAKSVANMFDYDLLFYTGGIVAKRSWAAAHRNDTMNVVRGYLAGVAAVYRDKRAATAAMSKYLKITDPELLEQNYQMLMKVLSKDQVPRAAGITTGLEASKLPAAKTADPNTFIDPSFVEELGRDGFTETLYR